MAAIFEIVLVIFPINKLYQDFCSNTCVPNFVKIDQSLQSLSRCHTHTHNHLFLLSLSRRISFAYQNISQELSTCVTQIAKVDLIHDTFSTNLFSRWIWRGGGGKKEEECTGDATSTQSPASRAYTDNNTELS